MTTEMQRIIDLLIAQAIAEKHQLVILTGDIVSDDGETLIMTDFQLTAETTTTTAIYSLIAQAHGISKADMEASRVTIN